MDKVLVVEDDELIATMIQVNLERQKTQVVRVDSAELMFQALKRDSFDLAILDIMLPGMNGDNALREMKKKNILMPVLILTSLNEQDFLIQLLQEGADDFLIKPFNIKELLARIQAIIRRSRSERILPADQAVSFGGYLVNFSSRISQSNIGEILLTPKETDCLRLFWKKPNQTITRKEIIQTVWKNESLPTPRVVDNMILRFRKLYEEEPSTPQLFITVHSIGYILKCF